MVLKDELISITKKSQERIAEDNKKKEQERKVRDDKRVKDWPQDLIDDLPNRMREVAKLGESKIVLSRHCSDEVRKKVFEIVRQWAKKQGFKTKIKDNIIDMYSFDYSVELIIGWKK